MTTIPATVQAFSADDLIVLYQLDATSLGGGVYCFTSVSNANQPIVFGGQSYFPVDVECSGFEWSGKGALPTPQVKISAANQAIRSAAITYNDLLGALFYRIRTMKKYLDGMPEADPNATLPIDVFKVSQKVSSNKVFIEWQLASAIDQEGRQLPGRQIVRNNCTQIYRFYNTQTGTFDYTKATCPYSGTAYFDNMGNKVTDPSKDVCGKLISSCKLRFGTNGNLPFRGFPGVGKN